MTATSIPSSEGDVLTVIRSLEFDWSAPIIERGSVSRVAPVTDLFWDIWNACRECCEHAGLRVFKEGSGFFVRQVGRRDDVKRVASFTSAIARLPVSPLPTADLAIPLPAGRTLLPFQAEDVRRMAVMRSVLLASEPGTGKTVQVAALANAVRARSVLVIAPARLLSNWKAELSAWRVVADEPLILSGSDCISPEHERDVVVSYETAVRPNVLAGLRDGRWDVVAFDEAHALGNIEADRTQALIGEHAIDGGWRILASGTPFRNRPIELWPLLRWLDPQSWPDRHAFGLRYCGARMVDGEWIYRGAKNGEELRARLLSTRMLRRLKRDVLPELSEKSRSMILLPPDEAQSRLMKLERDATRISTDADDIADRMADVSLGHNANLTAIRVALGVSKVAAIVEHVTGIVERGEKVVVFVHHQEVANRVAAAFADLAVIIGGKQTSKRTDKSVQAFKTDPDVMVAVCSIRAAGVGLTLTEARHVVFGECDWSPCMMAQAEDRVHRIGQTRPVQVDHIVLDGSLDKISYGVNSRKSRAFRAVFG